MNFDVDLFLQQLKDKYPNVVTNDSEFWNNHFKVETLKFIEVSNPIIKQVEEISPYKFNKCPCCNVIATPGDNYCFNCGARFVWKMQ